MEAVNLQFQKFRASFKNISQGQKDKLGIKYLLSWNRLLVPPLFSPASEATTISRFRASRFPSAYCVYPAEQYRMLDMETRFSDPCADQPASWNINLLR